jgi:putative membrane protein
LAVTALAQLLQLRSAQKTNAKERLMNLDFLLTCLHHIALLVLVASLAGEVALMRQAPSASGLQALGKLDVVYGISAGALLVIGLSRVFWAAKGASYYLTSLPFWIKMFVFLSVGLLSIVPTVRFIRWRKALAQTGALPSQVDWDATRKLAVTQLHSLALIVIAAAAMARGLYQITSFRN